MSGFCGIVNSDGAPVEPELLRKMAEAAAYRGPDVTHYWIEGNADPRSRVDDDHAGK